MPRPAEPVVMSCAVADPDGVAWVSLWSSVDGAPFVELTMDEATPGLWRAQLDGQAAGAITQFYIEAQDELGERATFPAAGLDARALFITDEAPGSSHGRHAFRLLMTQDDADWLHEDVNLMSNDRVGATVVYREAEVFYDVGVRLKGKVGSFRDLDG